MVKQNDTEQSSKSFNEGDICNQTLQLCDGVADDEAQGIYGSFRTCRPLEKASWAKNQEYLAKRGNDAAQCSSLGGVITQPIPSASQASDCRVLLEQAGPAGTGTITFTPPPPTSGLEIEKSQGSNLSANAKYGIAGGGVAFFILVSSAILFLYYRARQRQRTKGESSSPKIDGTFLKAELEHSPVTVKKGAKEQSDNQHVFELEGDHGELKAVVDVVNAELGGDEIKAELEGDMIKAELEGDIIKAELEGDTVMEKPGADIIKEKR